MTRPFASLRARLTLSHLVVVFVGGTTMLIAGNRLAPGFIDQHIEDMEMMARGTMDHESMLNLEDAILAGFGRALLLAAVVSIVAALLVALVLSSRLLRPLDLIRRVTRRLAAGAYDERLPEPRESELAALAADVNSLASALEETEARRLRLVGEVAHELRTPLATIKGYMEGLIDGVFAPDEEVFVAVEREAERLERLAIDLNRLSRAEEEQDLLRLEPVDVLAVAAEVADRLQPQFADHDIDLHVASGPTATIQADRDRIAQVFTNVIGNALSYTPRGGRVTVTGDVGDDEIRVHVTDTGRGLTPDQLDAVFERFYRGDRSAPGGTGIGLTIARSIARRHGGDIDARSPGPGSGSTFTITLPVDEGNDRGDG